MNATAIPGKTASVFFPAKLQVAFGEYELPDAPPDGKAIVENEVTLISAGTELAMYTETHISFPDPNNKYAKYPFFPGYNGVGIVRAVGEGVTNVKVGDRLLHGGKHRAWDVVDPAQYGPLPPEVTSEQALILVMANISMAALRVSQVKVGADVVVIGLGLVGNLAGQLFRVAGGRRIVGIDLCRKRLDIAAACGFDHLINPSDGPVEERVKAALGGKKAEIVVEAIGLAPTISQALQLAAPFGQVLLLGSPRKKMEIDPYNQIHGPNVSLIGAHAWRPCMENPGPNLAYLKDLVISKRLKVDNLITGRLPFRQIEQGYKGLLEKPDDNMGIAITYR